MVKTCNFERLAANDLRESTLGGHHRPSFRVFCMAQRIRKVLVEASTADYRQKLRAETNAQDGLFSGNERLKEAFLEIESHWVHDLCLGVRLLPVQLTGHIVSSGYEPAVRDTHEIFSVRKRRRDYRSTTCIRDRLLVFKRDLCTIPRHAAGLRKVWRDEDARLCHNRSLLALDGADPY